MTKLTVLAAAFAVGLTTFAVHAQDLAMISARPDFEIFQNDFGIADRSVAKEGTEEDKIVRRKGMTAEEVFHAERTAKPGKPYRNIIERYASLNGVSVSLAHAVITVESNYQPYSLGKAGEVGLMQIKPATARLMGYDGSTTGLFDPETNIKYGMKYLGKAQRLGDGTTCGTILKYNAGHAAKRMNPVSLDYCGKVKRHLEETDDLIQSDREYNQGV